MRTTVLFATVLAAACGSAGGAPGRVPAALPPSIETSGASLEVRVAPTREVVAESIPASADAVWSALPKAYADLGIQVAQVSESNRVLGNPKLVLIRRLGEVPLSRYFECGSGLTGPFADRYRIELLLRTSVVPGGSGASRLETYVDAQARNPEGSSNTGVTCASTGRLEREIAERVRARVGSGQSRTFDPRAEDA
jgi:hypothetical protein